MDNNLEQTLREHMKRQTESIPLPEDMLSRGVGRSQRRRTVRRRLMAGGGALGVAILAAGLFFGVTLAQGGGQPSGSKVVASNHPASASTTTATTDKKALAIIYLRKTLAVTTPAKGDILHVKQRIMEHAKSLSSVDQAPMEESWGTEGSKWMSRQIEMHADGTVTFDELTNYSGLTMAFFPAGYSPIPPGNRDLKTVIHDKPKEGIANIHGFMDAVQEELDLGLSEVDGHEQINGRDAVRIVSVGDRTGSCTLIDAETGMPMEIRSYFPSLHEYNIQRFDVFEILPGTPENLKVFDTEAFHPGVPATVLK